MSNNLDLLRIAINLPSNIPKANRLAKAHKIDEGNKLIKEICQRIFKQSGRTINIINLNDNLKLAGSLIVSNHQDNLDILVLFQAFYENVRFIAKKELFNTPLLKPYIKLSQSYSLDRQNPRQGVKVFKQALTDINNGANVIVFPEGTRSRCDIIQDFNSGLFSIFKRLKKPIIPVYIDGTFDNKRRNYNLIIGKPIIVKGLCANEIKETVYNKMCELKKEYVTPTKKYRILGLGDSITFGEMNDGSYGEGYYQLFIEKLKRETILDASHNLSIPSFSITDIIAMINNDDYQTQLNNILKDKELVKKLAKENNLSIKEYIKQADYIILSAGANDILKAVSVLIKQSLVNDSDQKFKLNDDIESLYCIFEMVYQNSIKLIDKINEINPDVQIIYLGQYFPYAHSKSLIKYNLINILDTYLKKLELKYSNVNKVIISKQVDNNKDAFLPNKRNIHLSNLGYEYLYEQVMQTFIKLLRKNNGYK